MAIDPEGVDWESVVADWWSRQPHPEAPGLTIGEYPIAVKLATKLKFGGHATPDEAQAFWTGFQQMNHRLQATGKLPLSPDQFMEVVDKLAPISFAYHNRAPTLTEVATLADAHPKDVQAYYGSMPDEHYPHVPAAEMVRHLQRAKPWAEMIIGRPPNKGEAAYLYHSGDHPRDYYMAMKEDDGGANQTGGYSGDDRATVAGGQQAGS
jgi:hypothetical protein